MKNSLVMVFEITGEDLEIVKEVANIGMGHASTALGQLLNRKVEIKLPTLDVFDKANLSALFKGEEILVGLHLRLLGDINGTLLYFFKKEAAVTLVDFLDGSIKKQNKMLTDMEIGTIKEIANILSGAYLSALSEFSGLKLLPSMPHFVLDSASSILDFITTPADGTNYHLILIKNSIAIVDIGINVEGTLFVLLSDEELNKLLTKIKIKYQASIV